MLKTAIMLVALGTAAHLDAQAGGAAQAGAAPAAQPAPAQSRVGQPPQNSAMRQSGAGGESSASRQASGQGAATPTNAMTLTLGGASGAPAGDRGEPGSSARPDGRGQSSSGRQGPSYDATGVLRSPSGPQSSGES